MCLRWIYIDVESFDGMVRKKRQVMCVCCVYFPYLEMMFVCMLWINRKRRLATTTPSPPPKKTRWNPIWIEFSILIFFSKFCTVWFWFCLIVFCFCFFYLISTDSPIPRLCVRVVVVWLIENCTFFFVFVSIFLIEKMFFFSRSFCNRNGDQYNIMAIPIGIASQSWGMWMVNFFVIGKF